MNPPRFTRRLDEKIVPALARALGRLVSRRRIEPAPTEAVADRVPAPRRDAPPPSAGRPSAAAPDPRPAAVPAEAGAAATRVPKAPRRAEPPPGSWRGRAVRLDDRFARRGPLGHLRAVPQTGITLAAVLLLVGALAAAHLSHRHPAPVESAAAGVAATVPASCPVGSAVGSAYVGPAVGTPVPTYLTAAATTVARCAEATPGERLYAVVSLTAAETPMQAAEALRGVTLAEVFVQIPAASLTPYLLPVAAAGDGVVRVDAAILAGYATAEHAFLADRGEQLAAATTAAGARKQTLQVDAARDELAAAQLRTGCACTYAAVAVGTVAQLAALRTSDVSVIALAPAGVTAAGITARPLLPTETSVLDPAATPQPLVAGSIS